MRQAGVELENGPLRTIMSGGESLGSETLRWAREHLGARINEIYGQTEANLLVGNSSEVWNVRAGSMGRPFPGHAVSVLDPDGRLDVTDADGEIIVRADDPVMMLRYWNNPEATEEKYVDIPDSDGSTTRWLRTGDLGRKDAAGHLWCRRRSKTRP